MFYLMDLIIAMGFAWMLSGIIQLILNQNRNSAPAWPGSLLIFILGLSLLDNFLKPDMLPQAVIRLIYLFSRNSYFLIGPFLLFYTRSLLSSNKIRPQLILHLIPFFIMAVHSIAEPTSLIPIVNAPELPRPENVFIRPGFIREILSILLRGGYCYYVFRIIRRHSKTVPDFYSRKTIRNTLSWLFYLTVFYLLLFIFNFFVMMLPAGNQTIHFAAGSISRLAPSIFFIFFFTTFAQSQKIPEINKLTNPENDIKYRNSGLSDRESKQLFENLNRIISEKRLFLDPDLNLEILAKETGETRHRLSEVINREAGEKFYSYINNFRLKEFITAVEDNRYPQFTILAVAMECGFKSQSAFYNLFKQKMGITPKEFLKMTA